MKKLPGSAKLQVYPSCLKGEIQIPGSKSHTIRALIIAALAPGKSEIHQPLVSDDTLSCARALKALGATLKDPPLSNPDTWVVQGFGSSPQYPAQTVHIGNSGTSLRLLTAVASLFSQKICFDGDESIRQRPMKPLLDSLRKLGVHVHARNEKCPLSVKGPLQGGKTAVEGYSSQYVSALLIAAPRGIRDTEIITLHLHEQPYVQMTLDWLMKQSIELKHQRLDHFWIKGGQNYHPFIENIPADFSSATFPLCAAAITGSQIMIKGLDFSDSQGDKKVFSHLEDMGLKIAYSKQGVFIQGGELSGIEIDLNDMPDALPALAVVGCVARGETRLLNVPQARLKECDRISAIATELGKMGAQIEELRDGLIIHPQQLKGAKVHGYKDHRMVMALALAGMVAEGRTVIDNAETVSITYPAFVHDMQRLGAAIQVIE